MCLSQTMGNCNMHWRWDFRNKYIMPLLHVIGAHLQETNANIYTYFIRLLYSGIRTVWSKYESHINFMIYLHSSFQ